MNSSKRNFLNLGLKSNQHEDHSRAMKSTILLPGLLALPLLVALPQGTPDLVDVRQCVCGL